MVYSLVLHGFFHLLFDKNNCHPWNYFWCHSICRICHRCHYFCNIPYNGSSLAITLVYSYQIQALAALWRLFRGRKLNPLRQRLDSYGYTVKQLVVGSLLFTPLLLLLPTTSVFYIFFTITSTTINSICMLIEFAISVIHATPYAEIMIWLVRRRRFPSGVWFETEHYGEYVLEFSNDAFEHRSSRESQYLLEEHNTPEKKSSLMVSTLRSKFLSIGQILLPHYTTIFLGISASSLTTSARGILSGKRMPSKLGLDLPPPRPWMHMPLKQYWILCHNSIISSMGKGSNHKFSWKKKFPNKSQSSSQD